MSSLAKMLAILDLFTPERPTLTADEIIGLLGYSQPTGYRYIQELCNAGLLSSQHGAYWLGVRIIELDYQIRRCDPLLGLVRPVMIGLKDRLSCDVLLTVYFGGRMVVAHHEQGADPITVTYGRGHSMPLLWGAGSKAILSALPSPRLKRLYEAHSQEIADGGMGKDWPAFRSALAAMRRQGHVVSRGELDPGNVGLAAAIAITARTPPASLTLVFNQPRYDVLDHRRVAAMLQDAKAQAGQALAGHLGSLEAG